MILTILITDISTCFQDKLYMFMEGRYLVKDIMYLCNFDFISAVVEYSDQDRVSYLPFCVCFYAPQKFGGIYYLAFFLSIYT